MKKMIIGLMIAIGFATNGLAKEMDYREKHLMCMSYTSIINKKMKIIRVALQKNPNKYSSTLRNNNTLIDIYSNKYTDECKSVNSYVEFIEIIGKIEKVLDILD